MIIVLSGCTEQPQIKHHDKLSTPQSKQTIATPTEKSLPLWIMNPNQEGYLCEVGSVTIQDKFSITKRTALIIAKARISQQIKLYVDTQLQQNIECNNDRCKTVVTSKTTLISSNMIKNVTVHNSYHDNKNQRYYMHLCTALKNGTNI